MAIVFHRLCQYTTDGVHCILKLLLSDVTCTAKSNQALGDE